MSFQRKRRGQPAVVYASTWTTDRRDNASRQVNMDAPINTEGVFIPQRSAKAEVAGQADINVVRMIVNADIADVDIWGRVLWRGTYWDVVTPPAYHHGTRHTRHWTIDLRERPS